MGHCHSASSRRVAKNPARWTTQFLVKKSHSCTALKIGSSSMATSSVPRSRSEPSGSTRARTQVLLRKNFLPIYHFLLRPVPQRHCCFGEVDLQQDVCLACRSLQPDTDCKSNFHKMSLNLENHPPKPFRVFSVIKWA